jgi:hypothetical protein
MIPLDRGEGVPAILPTGNEGQNGNSLALPIRMIVLQRQNSKSFILLIAVIFLLTCLLAARAMRAQTATADDASKLTEDRLKQPGWWPTKGDRARSEYVGAAECATCHVDESKTFRTTAMANAATPAHDAESLRQHNRPAFKIGPYSYQLTNSGGRNIQTISKGSDSHSDTLLWAFGVGRMAQTYLYQENGSYFEGHLSFYTTLQGLEATPGHPHTQPPNLEEGAGRRISSEEQRRCFGCHTTASTTQNRFDAKTLVPGVNCEACHGPGAAHVAAVKSGNLDQAVASIVNPEHMSPLESVEFCGACHRTWQDVVSDGPTRIGPLNIRFAPYRLENSRCWKEGSRKDEKGEARITCVTCHDPHKRLVEDPAKYDAACLKCHLAAGQNVDQLAENHRTACPIGVKLCVTCHMPKFKSEGFHFTFTDHWIRIAAPGAPLPD